MLKVVYPIWQIYESVNYFLEKKKAAYTFQSNVTKLSLTGWLHVNLLTCMSAFGISKQYAIIFPIMARIKIFTKTTLQLYLWSIFIEHAITSIEHEALPLERILSAWTRRLVLKVPSEWKKKKCIAPDLPCIYS